MQRLRGADARFLYNEMPTQPMHTIKVLVLDPSTSRHGYTFERLRDYLVERVARVEPLRRRLVPVPLSLFHPLWANDGFVNPRRQIQCLQAAGPGGLRELCEIVSRVASRPLDRTRPLWEILALTDRSLLSAYAGFMEEEVKTYLQVWPKEGVVELMQLLSELTVFIPSRCLIGLEFRRHLSPDFARIIYRDLAGSLNPLAILLPGLPLPSLRRRDRARREVAAFIAQIVTDRRRRGAVDKDFLHILMTARYADGTSLSDEHITNNLIALIFSGLHTTAAQGAWTGVELLRHPAYLRRVLREQDEILGNGRAITLEAVDAMVVLERAVREAERLHPVPVLLRKVLRDFQYRDYTVPAGWLAIASPGASHLLPELFTDPHRYDPDRFAPERAEQRRARFSIISFGGGKHVCTGMTFAYLEIKVIWSVLLREFELRLLDARVRPSQSSFWIAPRSPCRVAFRRRKRAG
ncbi:MAG: cytochrome P450 [Gemmataceae bacterium]|nr:cytochrome P450 [Gemmataceae bacterium]